MEKAIDSERGGLRNFSNLLVISFVDIFALFYPLIISSSRVRVLAPSTPDSALTYNKVKVK